MVADRLNRKPTNVSMILLPDYEMLPTTAVVEALRLANYIANKQIYNCKQFSVDGKPVVSSNGMTTMVEGELSDTQDDTLLLVCGEIGAFRGYDKSLVGWLKANRSQFFAVGSLCNGIYHLAEAQLIQGNVCTLNWDSIADFRRRFPTIEVSGKFFEISENRMSCAAGTSSLDMILAFISAHQKTQLAISVADALLFLPFHGQDVQPQLTSTKKVHKTQPRLREAVLEMQHCLSDPIQTSVLATKAGVSQRQLERLFRRYFGTSPKRFYLQHRLQTARKMLIEGSTPVKDVAESCGFRSMSHFIRRYQEHFRCLPSAECGLPAAMRSPKFQSAIQK